MTTLLMAIGGGLATAATNVYTTKKLANAYKDKAKDIRNATEQYSGHNADVSMTNAGNIQGQRNAKLALDTNANKAMTANNAMANAQNAMNNNSVAQDAMLTGQSIGRNMQGATNAAKYNATTMDAENALNVAKKDYDVANQMVQGGLNSAAQLASAGSEAFGGTDNEGYSDLTYQKGATLSDRMRSDERSKEGYHNKQGIPEADAEDALRQVESIEYQYKPETGLDQDKHVGVSAQSLQGTAFDDAVNKDGKYLTLDKQKLLESTLAGIAALQKEIDALRGDNKASKGNIVSDERIKKPIAKTGRRING